MDRKLQQQQLPQKKFPGDGDDDQDDQDRNQGSGSRHKGRQGVKRRGQGVGKSSGFRGSAGMTGPTDAIEIAINMASICDVVFLYLQYDIYDSLIPASFLRSAPSIIAHTPFCPRAINTYGPEECLAVVLTSEIGQGTTGVVLRGTLEPEILDCAMPLDVVVKLAFNFEQPDALRSECEVYRCLRLNGVHGEPQGNLLISDCKSAVSTLESIHCAGILHGDICQDNILIGDSGVTIIDFGHSIRCGNQRAKDQEIGQLRYLLGLADQ